jgi:protein-disulfide isomerase
MSNRQARREQMRGSTAQRGAQRPGGGRPGPGRPTPSPRRSGGGLFSGRFILLIGLLVVAAIASLAFVVVRNGGGDGKYTSELTSARTALPTDMQNGFKLGKDDAPVKLTSYEDFQCPFCLGYTATEEPPIIENYVKTGKVQLIYQNLPILGTESVNAAKGGVCAAAQNKFWEWHSELFTIQAKASQATDEKRDVGRFADAQLKQIARNLGLDGPKFDSCYDDAATTSTVQDQLRKATSLGFRSTPSFTINDLPFGSGAPATYAGWVQVLDQAVANPPTPSPASPTAAPSGTAAAPSGTAAAPSATSSPSAGGTPAAGSSPAR